MFGGSQQQDGAAKSLAWRGFGSIRSKLQEQTDSLANKVAAVASQAQAGFNEEKDGNATNNILKGSFWQEPSIEENAEKPSATPTLVALPPPENKSILNENPIEPPAEKPAEVASTENNSTVEKIAAAPKQPLSTRDPKDISKDKIMEVLGKMNKRVKQLNLLKTQLSQKVENYEEENDKLKRLIKNEIISEIDIEEAKTSEENLDEIDVFRKAWRTTDERNSLMLQQLQNEFKIMTMKKAAELEKMQMKYQDQISRLMEETNSSPTTAESSADSNNELNEMKANYEKQIQALKEKYEEENRSKLDGQRKKLEDEFQNELKTFISDAVSHEQSKWNAEEQELIEKYEKSLENLRLAKDRELKQAMDKMQRQILERESKFSSLVQKMKDLEENTSTLLKQKDTQQEEKIALVEAEKINAIEKLQHDNESRMQQQLEEHNRKASENQGKELKRIEQDFKAKLDHATNNLEISNGELAQWKRKAQSNAEQMMQLNSEISNLKREKDEINSNHAAEIDTLNTNFKDQLNQVQKDFYAKNLEASEKHKQQIEEILAKQTSDKKEMEDYSASELKSKIAEKEKEHEAKVYAIKMKAKSIVDNLKKQLEEKHQTEMKKLQDEGKKDKEKAVSNCESKFKEKMEELKNEHEMKIQILENDLSSSKEQIKNSAAVAAQGEQSARLQIEETLSKQKTSYENLLKTQEDRYTKQISELRDKYDTAQTSINQMEKENKATEEELSSERSDLKNQISSLSEALEKTKSELQSLQENSTKEHNDVMTNMKKNFENSLTSVKQELENTKDELQKVSKMKVDLTSSMEEQKKNFDDQTKQLEKSSNLIKIEKEKVTELQNNISTKEMELDKSKLDLDTANTEIDTMSKRYKEIERQNKELHSQIDELQISSKNQKSKLDAERDSEISSLQTEMSNLKTSHVEEMNKLKATWKAGVMKKLAEKDEKMEEMKAKYENEMKLQKSEYESKIENHEAEHNSKLDSIVKELKVEVETAKEERQILHQELKSLDEKSKKEIKELSKSHTDNIELMKKEKNDALNDTKIHYNELTEKFLQEKQELEEQILKLKSELDSSKNQINEREEMHETHKNEVKSMQIAHNAAINELQKQHDVALKKLQSDHEKQVNAMIEEQQQAFSIEKSALMEKLRRSFNDKLQSVNEQHTLAKKEAEQDKSQTVAKIKAFFETKVRELQADHNKILSQIKTESAKKDQNISRLETDLTSSRTLYSSVSQEKEALLMQFQSLRSTEQTLRKSLSSMKSELEETVSNSSATATSLLEEQDKLRKDNLALAEKLTSLKNEYNSSRNEVEELNGKLRALSENLNVLSVERKENDQKLIIAQKQEEKLKATESEIGSLREEVSKLKLEQTKNAGIVARLQAEKDANERKHGQRTALVGMLEAQLTELNEAHDDAKVKLESALYDLSQKDDTIRMLEDQLERKEKSIREVQSRKPVEIAKSMPHTLTQNNQGQGDGDSDNKKSKMVEALQKEVISLQQQMARKSAAAQRLLQEREAECVELRKANSVLQQEIDMGTLSDKRIIELAAKQSSRDFKAASEVEVRDKIVKRLTTTLLSRDSELAEVEYSYQQVNNHVEELSRVKRREDVNLDYLKSIIVQYLSKPPGSSERTALLPVIATLLQFDKKDYDIIEEGKQNVSWFWGTIVPTVINAPGEANGYGPNDLSNGNPLYTEEVASLIPRSLTHNNDSASTRSLG